MIDKGKKSFQLSKRQKELLTRFKMTYERLNFHQRQVAKKTFCSVHGVAVTTFYNKMSGFSPLSETETGWMEAYDPYAQSVAA